MAERKSELLSGESLKMGQKLQAPHKNAALVFQKEGNVVWYAYTKGGPVALWATGSPSPAGNLLVMQKDGNLVLYNYLPKAGIRFSYSNFPKLPRTVAWHSNTAGHPGAKLVVQDDGNVVIYQGRTALWSTQTSGWLKTPGWRKSSGGGMFGWVSNVVKTAGAALHSVTKGISDVTGAITKAVGKIPIVGGPLKAAFDVALVGPFRVTDGIITGKRIDKVVFNELKAGVTAVKEVAPYVQTVASLVPGVGTGISGALGAGLAIADGRPITEALEAGIKGAIPGGPVGQSLYAVTSGVMAGKGVDEIALNALPIPDASKKALATALEVTKRVAKGERVDKIVIDKAKAEIDNVATKLGGEAAKSLKIGIAVGHAKELQSIMAQQAKSTPVLKSLVKEAKEHIKVDPVMTDAMKIVPKGKAGFMVGAALMKKQVTPTEFLAIRNRMKGENRKAFDLAASIHVGRVTHKEPPKLKDNPAARAGYYATLGMRGAKMSQKVGLLKAVDAHPQARQGSKKALQLVKRAQLGPWERVKYYLGLTTVHGESTIGALKPPKASPKPPPKPKKPRHMNYAHELPGHLERRIIHHSR